MATERKKTKLIIRLKFRQTNSAIGCGSGRTARDGGEREQRKRFDWRKRISTSNRILLCRSDAATRNRRRRRRSRHRGESKKTPPVKVTENKAENHRSKSGKSKNRKNDQDARTQILQRRRVTRSRRRRKRRRGRNVVNDRASEIVRQWRRRRRSHCSNFF